MEDVKKQTEGKNRVTADDFFECINAKNKVYGFLDCLIDERNADKGVKNGNANHEIGNSNTSEVKTEKKSGKKNV